MTNRCMQIQLPDDAVDRLEEILDGGDLIGSWRDAQRNDRLHVHVLVPADRTEPIMDRLEQEFGDRSDFRVILTPVEAVLPRPQADDGHETPNAKTLQEEVEQAVEKPGRVSREELYADVTETLESQRIYIAMTLLSSIVAAVGLIRNDATAIIGAMVIAPLLGPNMAMSLAATLGDLPLLQRGLLRSLVGFGLALGISIAVGSLIPFDETGKELADRTQVTLTDLILALVAGSAGTFAFTRGLSNAVIGVMVAVALMPPLVACGLLLGAGHWSLSLGAGLLTLSNILCINLAGVGTFLAQGVYPRSWYEQERARHATKWAIVMCSIALLALVIVLLVSRFKEQ